MFARMTDAALIEVKKLNLGIQTFSYQ